MRRGARKKGKVKQKYEHKKKLKEYRGKKSEHARHLSTLVVLTFFSCLHTKVFFCIWPRSLFRALGKGEISLPLTEAEVQRLFGLVGPWLYEVVRQLF